MLVFIKEWPLLAVHMYIGHCIATKLKRELIYIFFRKPSF